MPRIEQRDRGSEHEPGHDEARQPPGQARHVGEVQVDRRREGHQRQSHRRDDSHPAAEPPHRIEEDEAEHWRVAGLTLLLGLQPFSKTRLDRPTICRTQSVTSSSSSVRAGPACQERPSTPSPVLR